MWRTRHIFPVIFISTTLCIMTQCGVLLKCSPSRVLCSTFTLSHREQHNMNVRVNRERVWFWYTSTRHHYNLQCKLPFGDVANFWRSQYPASLVCHCPATTYLFAFQFSHQRPKLAYYDLYFLRIKGFLIFHHFYINQMVYAMTLRKSENECSIHGDFTFQVVCCQINNKITNINRGMFKIHNYINQVSYSFFMQFIYLLLPNA